MTSDVRQLLHDVRNPLNTISVNAELGKLVLQRGGDIDKALQIFDSILKECQQCSGNLRDLQMTVLPQEVGGSGE